MKLKPIPLALASLLCASSVWAADKPQLPEKDKAAQAAAKKPAAATVTPEASVKPQAAPAAAGKKTPAGEPIVELPELRISGRATPIAKQTDHERYRMPQTMESITREKINETINFTGAEDAIKYMPSIQVRSRYIGDTNAPVGTRTSGMASSARTLIYVDNVLISSLLGNNNGNTGSPRWQIVAPSEIERIEVLYGPFSAAYAGNSIGGVINITTRMPDKLEVGADAQAAWQNFSQYSTKDTYLTQRYSGNLGYRYKDLSFRFDFNHLDTHSQPISFANVLNSTTVAGGADTVVTGAWDTLNSTTAAQKTLGAGNINHSIQNNFKWKFAYDFTPTIRGTYTLGMWENNANASSQSYLRNSAGTIVETGNVNIGGNRYALGTNTFSANRVDQTTWSHGMNLRSNTGGKFDWELVGSLVDLSADTVRAPTGAGQFGANGAGRTTSLSGSGWHTVDARGIWRPGINLLGRHEVSFGFHHSQYELKNPVYNTTNWQTGGPTSGTAVQTMFSNSTGKTQTEGYWAQNAWDFAKDWNFTFGGRFESWHAYDGVNTATVSGSHKTVNQADQSAFNFSPKGKLTWTPADHVVLGAAIGQSYRYATAAELFQTTTTGTGAGATVINGNPNLKPEDAVSSELSAQYSPDKGRVRLSLFQERIKNAIFSQVGLIPNTGQCATAASCAVSFVNNIGQTEVYGVEIAADRNDLFGIKGLNVHANGTWTDARITENAAADVAAVIAGNTAANPHAADPSTGKRLPRVPEWKANAVVSYRINDKLTTSANMRYSSSVFSQINNSDTFGHTYIGNTAFTVVDLIANYKINKLLTGVAGINNVNNEKYWQFHMFPMRTYFVQARFNY